MRPDELIAELTAVPDLEQAEDRDVIRLARVRLRWNNDSKQWECDPPQGVSTYYSQRSVGETPKKHKLAGAG